MAALVAALALTACGGDGDGGTRAAVAVRDSAGIRVVENAGAVWAPGDEWTVSAEPVREIGVLEGEDAYMLNRVNSPLLRSDDVLVLANGGTGEIRAFGPDGALAWQAGGMGEGPGEFQSISSMILLPGDSVAVWDIRARRVSVVGPDGSMVRSYQAQPPEDAPMAAPTGSLDGGRFLVSGGVSFSTSDEGQTDEAIWPSSPHFVGDRDGNLTRRIVTVRTTEMRMRQSPQAVSIGDLPFARRGFAAAAGDRVVTAASPVSRLTWIDLQGDTVQIARWEHEPRQVDDAMVEEWVAGRLEENDDVQVAQYYRDLVEGVEIPDRVPSFTAVRVDPLGFVWVKQWRSPDAQGGTTPWWVFDSRGLLQGAVELPEELEVSQITETAVVGITRDELGVERVQVYRLAR